jgi:transcription elongation factor SPT6
MSANLLVDDVAELGSEEDDEDFDEETGEVRKRSNGIKGGLDDSSEEDDDDDEEEAAAVSTWTSALQGTICWSNF